MPDNETKINVRVNDEFMIPNIPNFIKRPDGSQIAIKQLSEPALKTIGKAWTAALIEKAKQHLTDQDNASDIQVQDPTKDSNFYKR